MATNPRGVIVGASTLLGKELIEELNTSEAAWDLRVADTADSSGQLVAGGDEALFVQELTPDVFNNRDIAFFATTPQTTRTHWHEAQTAGAAIVDLSDALEDEPGAIVSSPWIPNAPLFSAQTAILIPAHPAAVMLALVASRLSTAFGRVHLAATVLEPASQQGSQGLDELHQQTVNILGFHSLPQEVYDAQIAFNMRVGVGESAKVGMTQISATIRRHLKVIAGEGIASSVSFQLVQAPVFHGYTMSVYAQLPAGADPAAVRRALGGGIIHMTAAGDEAPTNQSVAEDSGIAISLTPEAASVSEVRGYWLWMAADNLKLAARHAKACAEQIAKSRAAKPE